MWAEEEFIMNFTKIEIYGVKVRKNLIEFFLDFSKI
jgi:hypothetical protein